MALKHSTHKQLQTAHLADGIITEAKLGALAVTTAKIATSGVITSKLADLGVTTGKIATSNVITSKLADLGVTTGKIATSNVITSKLADLGVTTGKIATSNVITSKLADLAATSGKIATSGVITSKLADLAATSGKIATSGVITTKVADANVTLLKLAAAARRHYIVLRMEGVANSDELLSGNETTGFSFVSSVRIANAQLIYEGSTSSASMKVTLFKNDSTICILGNASASPGKIMYANTSTSGQMSANTLQSTNVFRAKVTALNEVIMAAVPPVLRIQYEDLA